MKNTHILNNQYLALALRLVHEGRERAALLLAIVAVCLIFAYGYFLASTIVFAVEHKEALHRAAAVGSDIADLEVSYLSKKSGVSVASAATYGLIALDEKVYVERSSYVSQANVGN